MRSVIRAASLAALLVPALALAQDGDDGWDDADVVIPAVQHIDFEEVDVQAPLQRPGLVYTAEVQHKDFPPFIELRKSFSSEIRASVREVR